MTDKEYIKKFKTMSLEDLFDEVMSSPEVLTDSYYSVIGDAIEARYAELKAARKETPCLDGTTDSAKTTAVSLDAGLQKDLAQGNNLGDKK